MRTLPLLLLLLPSLSLLPSLALAEGTRLPATPENPVEFSRTVERKGGDGDGFTLAAVRLGSHGEFERLVLEFAKENGGGKLPRFTARSETYPERLVLDFAGVTGRAGATDLSYQALRRSRLLSGVDSLSSCTPGLSLAVLPARPVRYSLSTLTNPSRLVIDLAEAERPPLPDLRYSLQSLPLEGDAACVFLEMVHAQKGSPGRLLATASGGLVGEAGLYDSPDEARRALEGLGGVVSAFSLQIKARGPLDVPQD